MYFGWLGPCLIQRTEKVNCSTTDRVTNVLIPVLFCLKTIQSDCIKIKWYLIGLNKLGTNAHVITSLFLFYLFISKTLIS